MMLQQKRNIIIVVLLFTSLTCTEICAYSRTMFIPRLITTDAVFELGLTNYQFNHNKHEVASVFTIKPFYQSSHSANALARFFLPNNKTCVTLREDGGGDINPLWLNLISAPNTFYSSNISLKPQRTSAGAVFTWYRELNSYVQSLWFGINTALVHAQHNLNVRESNISTPGTLPGFKNTCDAFNNSAWPAGKLSCCSQSHTGLDDIQLKIGYDCVHCIDKHISPYIVGTIPTGTRPNARYVFEPLVGSKHGSLGLGLNTDFSLCNAVDFMFDAKYNYVFSSSERRSFDLHNGDWSRYLLVVTQAEPFNAFPGINSFTKQVRVTPGNTLQLWAALHCHHAAWQCEIGYNFWLRGKEKVAIQSCSINQGCGSNTSIGIFDMQVCNTPVTTAHSAKIYQSIVGSDSVVGDANFTPTTINDLNKRSAINPVACSNTIYGSCGYQSPCAPVFLALNVAYEFTGSCGAVRQYSIWGTFEIQF